MIAIPDAGDIRSDAVRGRSGNWLNEFRGRLQGGKRTWHASVHEGHLVDAGGTKKGGDMLPALGFPEVAML